MKNFNRGLLVLIAAACLVAAAGPLLALGLLVGAASGLFAFAVSAWALVLLIEDRCKFGRTGYSYWDAHDDAFDDVSAATRNAVTKVARNLSPSALKARFKAALPILTGRAKLVVALGILPFAIVYWTILDGARSVRRDLQGLGSDIATVWKTGRL
ncbi:hypothetical protein [Sphingomonas desiccabilis]|uniref:Uncharacterized protein n=1 Tax=Sphingomonas desiccabilis TaxID=429134 RepID=A0A4Q2IZZ9_9SPHN|nr:hypothetical protein [Sphingomonas desiccabilis]MBB3910139.1 hypothetical protein [Sphingomonas desiccabilis]RXZ34821.1 hypothetical protein EO081_03955 [Sphingomonas desiccabilis]